MFPSYFSGMPDYSNGAKNAVAAILWLRFFVF